MTKSRAVESVDQEIAQEKAEAFARAAHLLEAALAELARFDAAGATDPAKRDQLLRDAAERVFNVVVQREASGLRDPGYVFDFYGVPADVVARVGMVTPRRGALVRNWFR